MLSLNVSVCTLCNIKLVPYYWFGVYREMWWLLNNIYHNETQVAHDEEKASYYVVS